MKADKPEPRCKHQVNQNADLTSSRLRQEDWKMGICLRTHRTLCGPQSNNFFSAWQISLLQTGSHLESQHDVQVGGIPGVSGLPLQMLTLPGIASFLLYLL